MGRTLTIVVVAAVFATVMLLLNGLYWLRVGRKQAEARELSRRLGTLAGQRDSDLFRRARPQVEGLGRAGRALAELLVQAGNPMTHRALLTRIALAGSAGLVIGLVLTRSPAGLLGAACAYLPVMLLRSRAAARNRRITEQLPGALDLVARSLQAGHGLSESFRVCAQEMREPIAAEFGRVFEETSLGRDMREALDNLAERNRDNFDLRIFVSSVLLQRDTGGNLIEILHNIGSTVRARFLFEGKVRSLTAEARTSAWILGSLPFLVGMAIVYVQPAYLHPLLTEAPGRIMLAYMVVSFVVGVFVMRDLSKVEV